MGFNFHPTLWFVCRLCKHSFTSTETLNEHKLACHLGECLQIKCIIFEEQLLNEEWLPPRNLCENQNGKWSENKPENTSSLTECRDKIHLNSVSELKSFKNPFVSLTRLTNQEIKSLNQNDFGQKRQGKKSSKRKKLLERSSCSSKTKAAAANQSDFSKQKLLLVGGSEGDTISKITEYDFSDPQTSSSKNGIHSNEKIQPKKEFPSEVSTPENSVVLESTDLKLEDANDPEFIVPDIFPDSDEHEVPRILSSYSLSPASGEENHFSNKQDVHREIESAKESNNFDSNLTNVQTQIDADDSELLETSHDQTVQINKEKEPEACESTLSQHLHSDLPENRQSKSATDKSNEKLFMCEICAVFFRWKNSLKRHMLCHSSSKQFLCAKCPMQFKRGSDLSQHEFVHGNESKFKCRICSKCFSKKSHLVEHERIHTGDRPFKCEVANCEYASYSKGTLNRHIRTMHCEELALQQFVCPTCGKAYGVKKQLDMHIRIYHSDLAPFHCTHEGCTMTFKLNSYLLKHLKKHS